MMKKGSTSNESPNKLDRKIVERNRRIHMKSLCFKLASLVPSNHKYFQQYSKSKDMLAQQDQLDLAARYIKHMRERIEKLMKQKEQAMMGSNQQTHNNDNNNYNNNSKMVNSNLDTKLPLLELRDLGSSIEVVLVCELKNRSFMLYEVISILEEEGAEVVTASFSNVGDKIFYTVHAQVKISRVGVETTRVHERLNDLIAPIEIS